MVMLESDKGRVNKVSSLPEVINKVVNKVVQLFLGPISQQPPDVGFQSLFQGHCAANVATLGGRSKPERLCAFCACAFCIGGLATCDHCAANVATLGGRSKPERLCAFCACAFCVVGLATCDHCAANVATVGAGVNLSACMHFAHVRFALVHWLLCDHCAANVATLGGRSKPERLYAFCACAFCIALWDWLLATIALLMLLHWGAGVNLSASMHFAHVRFALVHWLLCDHCAANVATLGGRSKPEGLYAFCACAFCIALWDWLLAAIALLMLLHWGAGVNLSACMHFAHVRFALVHWLLCDHCAADVATVGGRSKPERLCAFCACAFCVGALATLRPLRC